MERLLDYFVPEKYVLDLEVDKDKKYIGGKVKVFGDVLAETVKFHAVGIGVEEVLIDGKKGDFEVKDGVLTLFKVPRSVSCIEVEYHGTLNENMEGAYLSTYEYRGETEVIVATQFESHYAREAFPCIDEPAAKAVFELALTVPEGSEDIILANTPAKNVVKNTTYFEPTPRMSTYLLAWVIGKFHGKTVENEHGTEITTYCALNQDLEAVDFANEVAAKSLEFYDDNFGVKYPLKRLVQVALPDFEAGAMENWGLVTYRESMLLAGKNATLSTKKSVALTVAHELSHQWFGDLVTMKWWDDLWLNESFASVMEYYAVDACYPDLKIWEGFFTGDALAALKRDCLVGVQSVHQEVNDPAEIATLFDPAIVYSKGARLMLMLIRAMGWEEFCKGLKDYFEKYKYDNTVGDNLWGCLDPYAEFDVEGLMHSFINQPGYPVVTGVGGGFDQFTQRRFLLDAKMPKSDWPLPEIREDMSGHYILNLSEEEFGERLERFDKMGLEEKIRLLIDRSLLAKTELVPSSSLLRLLEKFKGERNAAVWNIVLTIVAQLKVFFEYGSKEEKDFKEFVRGLVQSGIEEVGVVANEDDDENTLRMRAVLMGLAFYAEDMDSMRELADLYDEDTTKMNAESRADILDAKLYLEPEMLEYYLAKYAQTADPELKFELLFAGTVSKDAGVLHKMMELLDKPEVVKPQDQFHLFIYLFRNMEVQAEVMEWLTGHWEYVKKMAGDKSLENYPRYTAGVIRTSEMYEKWREFFVPMREDAALARAIEMGVAEIESRLKLIEADAEDVIGELGK